MTKAAVLEYRESQQDPRGIAHWERHAEASGGLKSFGLGLTKLRKYAKQLGRDAALAKQLWNTKVYEAKVLALLIDDPKTMTIAQAESQVEQLQGGYLTHVFSSCDATLAKTAFVLDLMGKWIAAEDPVRRDCGYGLLYEVSKWKKKSVPDEAAFLAHVRHIEATYAQEPDSVLLSMGGALLGIGKRSKKLHAAAIKVAKKIGPIEFDPTGACPPFDVVKNLSSDSVKHKLGL